MKPDISSNNMFFIALHYSNQLYKCPLSVSQQSSYAFDTAQEETRVLCSEVDVMPLMSHEEVRNPLTTLGLPGGVMTMRTHRDTQV